MLWLHYVILSAWNVLAFLLTGPILTPPSFSVLLGKFSLTY